jgi:glutathione S-transferase
MLGLLDLPFERRAVDAYPGGAQVPVLRDGELELRDTGLILMHLARGHDPNEAWLPPAYAAEIAGWLGFVAADLWPLAEARRVAVMGSASDLAALNSKSRIALRRLEDHLSLRSLAGADWIVAEGATIADIAIFPHVALSHDSGIGHEDYPAIHLWQRRVRMLPRFVTMPGIPDYH